MSIDESMNLLNVDSSTLDFGDRFYFRYKMKPVGPMFECQGPGFVAHTFSFLAVEQPLGIFSMSTYHQTVSKILD